VAQIQITKVTHTGVQWRDRLCLRPPSRQALPVRFPHPADANARSDEPTAGGGPSRV